MGFMIIECEIVSNLLLKKHFPAFFHCTNINLIIISYPAVFMQLYGEPCVFVPDESDPAARH